MQPIMFLRLACATALIVLIGVVAVFGVEPIGTAKFVQASERHSLQPSASHTGAANSKIYLPLIRKAVDNPDLAPRMGYGAQQAPLTYPRIRDLNAGWYVNWAVSKTPERPGSMEYVQMVRLHQQLECDSRVTGDRLACPYVEPHAYEFNDVDETQIQRIAEKNLGSTWAIGNECDRRDWQGGGQDEILAELYVEAYHEAYNWIKSADPTAKIAICGVIQPTPLRLEYLSRIWSHYKTTYGVDMPVDIWNTHLFAVREVPNEWGAEFPPGIDTGQGAFVDNLGDHTDVNVLADQARAFRQWMADRGQKNKPLYVTEYGVLITPDYGPEFSEASVHSFMLGSFDYMRTAKDCALSTVDDCRLVQRWAWFVLADIDWGFNPHTSLFNKDSLDMMSTGELFRQYTLDHHDELQYAP